MMRKQPSPRCSFLQQINEVSFAVNDMLLYLDTHPEDQKALRYFSDISDRRNQLMAEYAEKYGPLTIDSAAVSSENGMEMVSAAISMGKGRSVTVYVEL